MRVRTGGHGAGKSGFVLPHVAASPGRRPGSPARRAVADRPDVQGVGRASNAPKVAIVQRRARGHGDLGRVWSETSLCLRERLYRVESSNNSSSTPALSPFACSTACSRRTAPPPAAPPQSSVTPSQSPVVPRSARPASTSRRSRSWRLTASTRSAPAAGSNPTSCSLAGCADRRTADGHARFDPFVHRTTVAGHGGRRPTGRRRRFGSPRCSACHGRSKRHPHRRCVQPHAALEISVPAVDHEHACSPPGGHRSGILPARPKSTGGAESISKRVL